MAFADVADKSRDKNPTFQTHKLIAIACLKTLPCCEVRGWLCIERLLKEEEVRLYHYQLCLWHTAVSYLILKFP